MIYQEILIGYTRPVNLVGIQINENYTNEVFQMGDKNPAKPPKKKQKREKRALEEPIIKKKRRKPRHSQTA